MTTNSQHIVGAVFAKTDDTQIMVEQLFQHYFPMDHISILHKADELDVPFIGSARIFQLPDVGAVLLAGPLLDSITNAEIGSGRMASGAASTLLTIALRRIGIPEDKLELLHQAVTNNKSVLLMHCDNDSAETWRQSMVWKGAELLFTLPLNAQLDSTTNRMTVHPCP
ncbi:MAG: hypothetical protein HQL49_12485 [Gammaproteobacteria bacterium]|nr:hypothetical protein [Gammaproteobacteria bacterium]